eukprot:13949650-Alexandrium_andersonii.AAC.1
MGRRPVSRLYPDLLRLRRLPRTSSSGFRTPADLRAYELHCFLPREAAGPHSALRLGALARA